MTDTPEPIIPPIPDINGNGILDIQDIRAQLDKEKTPDGVRTPGQRAHGVFEVIDTRMLAGIMNMPWLLNNCYSTEELTGARNAIKDGLTDAIRVTIEESQTNPNFRKDLAASIADRVKTGRIPAKREALVQADYASMIDFALTFKDTFPSGKIELEPADILDITMHMGAINTGKKSSELICPSQDDKSGYSI